MVSDPNSVVTPAPENFPSSFSSSSSSTPSAPLPPPSASGTGDSSSTGAGAGVEEEKEEPPPEENSNGGGDGDDDDDSDDGAPPPPAAGGAPVAARMGALVVGELRAVAARQAFGLPLFTPTPATTPLLTGSPSRGVLAAASATAAVTGARRQDGKSSSSKDKKVPFQPFSPDLFIRRVHLLVGEIMEPVWRDPRLPSLPQEVTARVLAAVLDLMQSLQVCVLCSVLELTR